MHKRRAFDGSGRSGEMGGRLCERQRRALDVAEVRRLAQGGDGVDARAARRHGLVCDKMLIGKQVI